MANRGSHDPSRDELLVVVGPTASGKTEMAVRLAEQLGGEIIGADSVQIYRRFDIGSGKPTAEQRARVPHHLVDAVDPRAPIDAARWAELAEAALADVRGRDRVPIVSGGTFLWVRALVYGLAEAPPADDSIRDQHRRRAETEGRTALHAELAGVDAASAERLDPNDFVRVSRALEVFELTGTPLSELQAEHGFRKARHRARLVGVDRSLEELDVRIRERARDMLDAGWVDEVQSLLASGLRDARAMKSVGYRQIVEALDASESPEPVELLETIVRATRRFTRRQRTWLRDEPVEWVPPGAMPSER